MSWRQSLACNCLKFSSTPATVLPLALTATPFSSPPTRAASKVPTPPTPPTPHRPLDSPTIRNTLLQLTVPFHPNSAFRARLSQFRQSRSALPPSRSHLVHSQMHTHRIGPNPSRGASENLQITQTRMNQLKLSSLRTRTALPSRRHAHCPPPMFPMAFHSSSQR